MQISLHYFIILKLVPCQKSAALASAVQNHSPLCLISDKKKKQISSYLFRELYLLTCSLVAECNDNVIPKSSTIFRYGKSSDSPLNTAPLYSYRFGDMN